MKHVSLLLEWLNVKYTVETPEYFFLFIQPEKLEIFALGQVKKKHLVLIKKK